MRERRFGVATITTSDPTFVSLSLERAPSLRVTRLVECIWIVGTDVKLNLRKDPVPEQEGVSRLTCAYLYTQPAQPGYDI